jgi:hypothetical protein
MEVTNTSVPSYTGRPGVRAEHRDDERGAGHPAELARASIPQSEDAGGTGGAAAGVPGHPRAARAVVVADEQLLSSRDRPRRMELLRGGAGHGRPRPLTGHGMAVGHVGAVDPVVKEPRPRRRWHGRRRWPRPRLAPRRKNKKLMYQPMWVKTDQSLAFFVMLPSRSLTQLLGRGGPRIDLCMDLPGLAPYAQRYCQAPPSCTY